MRAYEFTAETLKEFQTEPPKKGLGMGKVFDMLNETYGKEF